ncbi:hypothetical protein AB0B78_24765 [Streptomyces sp. NPDC040724]|uniref:hypothetical protein n=1 Tax=Streptomyces sp. NPDC040724 TaxID=3155612 RepID=UPI0033E9AEB4
MFLLVLAGVAAVGTTPAQAAPVEITVSLYRVVELSCDEGLGESCSNDYYPKFEINHQGLFDGRDSHCCGHGTDFRTDWVYQATVDTSSNPIAIQMQLWDQDDLTEDGPINWTRSGSADLNLTFDLNTCVFTGGGLTTQQGAGQPTLAGESEGSGEDSARGYFTITTPFCLRLAKTADSDGDGIMNTWEVPGKGMDFDEDGFVELPLGDPPYGAVPYRKDLFVEADYMAKDKPQDGLILGDRALADVVQAFADAPVDGYDTPGGRRYRGINLHITEGEPLPDVPAILFEKDGPGPQDDFNDLKSGHPAEPCKGFFGTQADRDAPNCAKILQAKRQVYRYMIFGDSFVDDEGVSDASGVAEVDWEGLPPPPRGGNDFLVTLGSWATDTLENASARKVAESSTFMHELGHTLGLLHGGGDNVNCKPNYLSVMNYNFQFPDLDESRPLDYSSTARGTALGMNEFTRLDERELDERRGLYGTPDPARNTVYGANGKAKVVRATSPIDWNGNGNTESGIAADINRIDSVESGCSDATPGELLRGYDDWANIQYNPRLNTKYFADGARPNTLQELTEHDVRAMRQKADLAISKTADRADAAGGDTVNYTTTVSDLGPGTATSIHVTDTLPDGSTQQRSLPDLANGAVTTITPGFTYRVPCDTADGAVLANRVTVTGNDTRGVPDPYTSDNTAQAITTVHAPRLTVGTSATPAVNAGEAITYTLTYANTGSGGASGVTVTDTLPPGVYYSQALDLGTGPRPSSVTLNGDGSRTLVWNVGDLPAASGDQRIVFTARPTLLALSGTTYTDTVSVSYKNAGGACTFAPVTDSAGTAITVLPPTRNPLSQGFWRNHRELWTAEFLARIQATDQRYDTDRNGALSVSEAAAGFNDSNAPKSVLSKQLLSVYFNLASRRINAATAIRSRTTQSLGLSNVREAVIYTQDTLLLPVNPSTSPRYSSIIDVLTDINANRIEVYR